MTCFKKGWDDADVKAHSERPSVWVYQGKLSICHALTEEEWILITETTAGSRPLICG